MTDVRAVRLVVFVCTAQALAQIGAYTWPALLPGFMERWQLDNSEAGWLTGVFYGAYTLSVPILVTLTDRIDPKKIYLLGVGMMVGGHLIFGLVADGFWTAFAARVLTGVGWAGTYMTGLKLLADRVEGPLMSRAVAGHAASIGIAGALSFVFADTVAVWFDWRGAFLIAALCAAAAWLIALTVPSGRPTGKASDGTALFDFRPVFRNRRAMAYAAGYCTHTWEMNVLRGWGVAFLAFVAFETGAEGAWVAPTMIVTAMALIGTLSSIGGNEMALRFGRRRLVHVAMVLSIGFGAAIGFVGALDYGLAAVLVLFYGAIIWLDSSSLTAGTAENAEPERRGATLAIHSMLGYAGGFVGPVVAGWTLDAMGGMSKIAWGVTFAVVAAVMLTGRLAFVWLGRPAADDA